MAQTLQPALEIALSNDGRKRWNRLGLPFLALSALAQFFIRPGDGPNGAE